MMLRRAQGVVPRSAADRQAAAAPLEAAFPTVFAAELERVRTSRQNRQVPGAAAGVGPTPEETADEMELVGLSFSGGGIRSATFNLGVLQALAKTGVLRHVDYLSTVSGGGYIGAWLQAMIHRVDTDAATAAQGMRQIEPGLNPDNPAPANQLPQDAIAYLRAFSNYLTPKVSILSADTWTMAAIWFRNTILNLTILVAGIAALMLAARTFGIVALVRSPSAAWESLEEWVCLVFLLVSAFFLGLNVGGRLPKKLLSDGGVQWLVVAPGVVAAMLVTALLRHNKIPSDTLWIFQAGGVLTLLFLLFQSLADFWGCFLRQHDNRLKWLWGLLLQVGVAALSGLVTAWLFHLLALSMEHWKDAPYVAWLLLTVCPPIVLAVLTLGVIVNIGLLGRDIPDDVREWTGRLGAWVWIYSAAWLLFFGAAIYGPVGMQELWGWAQYTVTGAWIAATAASLLAGKSSKTGRTAETGDSSTSGMLEVVARVGPYVFVAGFVVAISLGVHEIVSVASHAAVPPTPRNAVVHINESGSTVNVSIDSKSSQGPANLWKQYWEEMGSQKLDYVFKPGKLAAIRSLQMPEVADTKGLWYMGVFDLLLVCVAVAVLMSWRVDINEFSLNHFYKNRLVRCYLGAARRRRDRRPDPFTKFDSADDIRLNALNDARFSGPFPIINATLNLSSGRNLAWQERQGASFIFTPIYSGYDTGGEESPTSVSRRVRVGEGVEEAGYYPTRDVAKTTEGGISMGTAIGISGAAANPNSGFHTSTAVAFLMTVFDVRLGWWLGNPAKPARADWSGPTFGLPYTVAELFGTTDADNNFVNLSDGGHFDNMGLYELIRRGCRYIIVCDAEQDENLQFGGLTTAVRMCRTDFGVEIDFHGGLSAIARRGGNEPERFSGAHFAVADIKYIKDPKRPPGKLIYVKSSLTGDEPADVLGYHKQVPLFPHESTADQWFNESQFESYRRLGQHIGEVVFLDGAKGKNIGVDGKDQYFQAL